MLKTGGKRVLRRPGRNGSAKPSSGATVASTRQSSPSGRTLGRQTPPADAASSRSLVPAKGGLEDPSRTANRQLQQLWQILARLRWHSLVVVPAHAEGSTSEFVRSLAQVGNEFGDLPVASAAVATLGAGAARSLATLVRDAKHQEEERRWLDEARSDARSGVPLEPSLHDGSDSAPVPLGRLVIGVPSVVAEPVGLGITDAADCVLLGVELGKTTTAEVKRSIELIGRSKIAGCVLL